MTVQVQRRGAVATIVLDRPAGDERRRRASSGDDLTRRVEQAAADDDGPRRRADRQRARRSAPARTCTAGFDARRRTATPTSRSACASATTRSSRRSAQMPKPVVAAVNGAGGRHRLLVRARVRPRSSRAESAYFLLAFVNIGLVPDGGSQLFDPGAHRVRPRDRDGDARRARAGAQALEWGLDQPRRRRRRARRRGRRARRPPRRRARRAPTPAASASSTTGCSRACRSSWSSRRASSRRWRARSDFVEGVDGVRARSGRPRFRAVGLSVDRAPRGRGHSAAPLYSRPSCLKRRPRRLLLALPAALAGALIAAPAATRAAFPETGGSPNADSIQTLYMMVFVLALFIFVGRRGHAALLAGQVPRPQGPRRPRRSTATRSSRSAGRSAPP